MVAITTNDLKNGMTLELEKGLFTVTHFEHVKPGKGPAFVRTTLKNVRTGAVLDNTFRAGEKVERAMLDKRDMQYLYSEADGVVMMDNETFDQLSVANETLGDAKNYMLEQMVVQIMFYNDEIIGIELPSAVELVVSQTDPGLQGDRSTGGTKPATMETGLQVNVPLFIETGEKLRIDTRTGDYIARAN